MLTSHTFIFSAIVDEESRLKGSIEWKKSGKSVFSHSQLDIHKGSLCAECQESEWEREKEGREQSGQYTIYNKKPFINQIREQQHTDCDAQKSGR